MVSIAAILNKHSQGKLLFGIRANGEVIGQDVSEQTIRDVSRAISENIEPRIYPKVQRLKLSGKTCIRVEFSGNDSPYLAYGRAYIRVGDEDKQASARELERVFLNRNKEAFRWESEPSTRKLSDIDERAVKMFIKKSNLAGRIDFEFSSTRTTLTKLGLIANGKLLKAAEVLFCRENPLEIQAAVFAGTDKRTFLDIKGQAV